MKCKVCNVELMELEWYVELEDGTIMDETCFFDYAGKQLKASFKQNDVED